MEEEPPKDLPNGESYVHYVRQKKKQRGRSAKRPAEDPSMNRAGTDDPTGNHGKVDLKKGRGEAAALALPGRWATDQCNPLPNARNLSLAWRGRSLGAGQTPVQRIRALHMTTATGSHCPGMPQQTAYILQVILA
jgi:hypothetical protein